MATNSNQPQGVVEQPGTALATKESAPLVDTRPLEIQKFEFQQRYARLYALSGLFADIKGQTPEQSIAQAFVKIQLGDSMGFNAAESMTGIDIIQGRVAVGSNLRGARMQRSGYSWDILQLDDKGCRLRLKKDGKVLLAEGDKPTIVAYTVEDATRAGLIGKDNYKKNPKNMFFSRAITNAQRWYAPGVLGVDILSTEEALDMPPMIESDSLSKEIKRPSELTKESDPMEEARKGQAKLEEARSVAPKPEPMEHVTAAASPAPTSPQEEPGSKTSSGARAPEGMALNFT